MLTKVGRHSSPPDFPFHSKSDGVSCRKKDKEGKTAFKFGFEKHNESNVTSVLHLANRELGIV